MVTTGLVSDAMPTTVDAQGDRLGRWPGDDPGQRPAQRPRPEPPEPPGECLAPTVVPRFEACPPPDWPAPPAAWPLRLRPEPEAPEAGLPGRPGFPRGSQLPVVVVGRFFLCGGLLEFELAEPAPDEFGLEPEVPPHKKKRPTTTTGSW